VSFFLHPASPNVRKITATDRIVRYGVFDIFPLKEIQGEELHFVKLSCRKLPSLSNTAQYGALKGISVGTSPSRSPSKNRTATSMGGSITLGKPVFKALWSLDGITVCGEECGQKPHSLMALRNSSRNLCSTAVSAGYLRVTRDDQ
jgi:hypothetical protein